jgi:hypothetical protein
MAAMAALMYRDQHGMQNKTQKLYFESKLNWKLRRLLGTHPSSVTRV